MAAIPTIAASDSDSDSEVSLVGISDVKVSFSSPAKPKASSPTDRLQPACVARSLTP